jgi:GTP-binding protein Era
VTPSRRTEERGKAQIPGTAEDAAPFRSGFVAVVGRPNVGKSTLVNRILGTKVTITSGSPNTTRRQVRGVLHRPGAQAVLVDTPGLHRARTVLGSRLNERVADALSDVDVVVAVVEAKAPLGPGDKLVLERAALSCAGRAAPGDEKDLHNLLVAVNKVDAASKREVLQHLSDVHSMLEGPAPDSARDPGREPRASVEASASTDRGVEYFGISAATGEGVEELVEAMLSRLPLGVPYFPESVVKDTPEAEWVAELVREQLLAKVHDELPHSIACRVTEWEWPLVQVEIVVERDSQKRIVVGRGGEVLKAVGTAVRGQLPPGAFLELRVRVEKHWQQRTEVIDRLGY